MSSIESNELLFDQYSNISQRSALTTGAYFQPSIAVRSLSPSQQQFAFQCSGINHSEVIAALTTPGLASHWDFIDGPFPISAVCFQYRRSLYLSHLINRLKRLQLQIDPLRKPLLRALTRIKAYLPPEERKICTDTVIPQLRKKSAAKITLSEALALLSLLVSIFFGVTSSMPDTQVERIIAQNEIIIEQQAEIVRLQKEDEDLLEALDALSKSINLLTDEIELLRDGLEKPTDLPDSSGQPDPGEAQQNNSDAQD